VSDKERLQVCMQGGEKGGCTKQEECRQPLVPAAVPGPSRKSWNAESTNDSAGMIVPRGHTLRNV
jgi:hypothetical protein